MPLDQIIGLQKETKREEWKRSRERDTPYSRPRNSPEKQSGNGRRVFVGNIAWETSWQDLKDHMKTIGPVEYANIFQQNGRSKGCGVVEFASAEDAKRAIDELNDSKIGNADRMIIVREDREQANSDCFSCSSFRMEWLERLNDICGAIFKEKTTQKLAIMKENKDPFYCSPYLGDQVQQLMKECERSMVAENPQEKYFLALIQPSMYGKSRLLFELSLEKPLLIVDFRYSNKGFWWLVNENITVPSSTMDSFEAARDNNRKIMCKLWLFLYSYLQFYHMFQTNILESTWDGLEVNERKTLNALLLNGGTILEMILKHNILETYAVDTSDNLEKLKNCITADFKRLFVICVAKEHKGKPWFAFDECHVPTTKFEGVLFHSDYKDHSQESVLRWNVAEMSSQKSDTPYKAKTTLFSGFRYILDELTNEFSFATLFASTKNSCWTILDESIYSRDKHLIIPVSTTPYLLNDKDIIGLLEMHNIQYDESDIKSFDIWCSRPGFFFLYCLPELQRDSTDSLPSKLECAKLNCFLRIRNLCRDENLSKKIKYYELFHDNEIKDEEFKNQCVANGFAINRPDGCFILEPMIKECYSDYRPKDLDLQKFLVSDFQNKPDLLAELAIANQILQRTGKSLISWFNVLDCTVPLPHDISAMITDCDIKANKCWSLKTARKLSNHPATDIFPGGLCDTEDIILPPNSTTFPDVLFIAQAETYYVLVSVQVKQYKTTIKDFENAVRSTSIHNFFEGSGDNQAKFKKYWKKQLKSEDLSKVLHVRVIVNWSGFTAKQIDSIKAHNKANSDQPIVLVKATETSLDHLYGNVVSETLRKNYPIKTPKYLKPKTLYDPKQFEMDLEENEKGTWDE